jgi:hypothetical protein
MIRRVLATVLAVLMLGSWTAARAQTAPRLRWSAGQVLLYRVELNAATTDEVGETKSETKTALTVTKRWQVKSVDAAGVATLQLSLTAMHQKRTTSTGDVLEYDSANPDKSTPQLKAALAKYVGTPLATIRVDAQGRVVEVKESKSPASSYENELPFVLVLPAAFEAGKGWERAYQITLPPPLGTGEKYDAVQRCTCKSVTAERATVTLSTHLKAPPKAAADAIPLWQMMPAGEATIDLKNGRLHAAKLEVNQELKDHQGKGSVCRFKSTQTIQYIGDR